MSLIIDPYRFATGDTFVMPYRQEVVPWSSVEATSGMTYTRTLNATAIGGGYAIQASLADADDGDYMEWSVSLSAGTYSLGVIYRKNDSAAIYEALLDGVSLGTIDGYVVGDSFNNVAALTGITVAADGNYTLRFKASGKNASSADYRLPPQWFTFTRTGA